MVVLTDGDIFGDPLNLTTVINSPKMQGVERFAIGVRGRCGGHLLTLGHLGWEGPGFLIEASINSLPKLCSIHRHPPTTPSPYVLHFPHPILGLHTEGLLHNGGHSSLAQQ